MNNIPVDPIALQCVADGSFDSIHLRIDSTGHSWSIVPGKSLLGSGPFHAYKKYDLDRALTHVKSQSEAKESKQTPALLFNKKKGQEPESEVIQIPQNEGEAQKIIQRFALNSIKRNGVMNILPRDSITVWEFKRPQPLLVARVIAVAKALGESKAVSRITADLSMRVNGCDTLRKWWYSSSAEQRWRLLTTRKVSGEAKEGVPDNIAILLEVECPFPDARIEVETFSDEDEENSFGGVSFASY
jgi:hypothetical protein